VPRSAVMVPIRASAVVTSRLMDILDFRLSSGNVWRQARKSARQNVWCLVTRSYQQLAGRSANFGRVTDGQMGGRFGDEGPETVVLHESYRGAEAAAWEVNLTTG